MKNNPYLGLPKRSRWDRAVARDFDSKQLYTGPTLIFAEDKVMSAGSCFAANIVPYLEKSGINYLRTESFCSAFPESAREAFAYDGLSARYGNIYTPRQLLQLLRRSVGTFKPSEDRWLDGSTVIDPFRPALKHRAVSEFEFNVLTNAHLASVRKAFLSADVLIFTLGLTEAWEAIADGAIFPACPGTIAGQYDESKYRYHNFTVDEVVSDMTAFVGEARGLNPNLRIILTVSPVPLVATIEPRHVLQSTVYSKSVLRVAADIICRHVENCVYFPAYEIVTGPQAPYSAFEDDRRNPSREIIDTVMDCFFAHCEKSGSSQPDASRITEPDIREIAKTLSDAECEEEAVLRD